MYLCLQTVHSITPTGYNRRTMSLQLTSDLLSFGSRSLLVRSSFVSRWLVVSLSKTERGPNEEQAKNERKSNECRARYQRETIEDSTRNDWRFRDQRLAFSRPAIGVLYNGERHRNYSAPLSMSS